jgi:hypothetical protein
LVNGAAQKLAGILGVKQKGPHVPDAQHGMTVTTRHVFFPLLLVELPLVVLYLTTANE